jgi:hypothetical protein
MILARQLPAGTSHHMKIRSGRDSVFGRRSALIWGGWCPALGFYSMVKPKAAAVEPTTPSDVS